jgi:NET1-associated nuclear protein 1 (U3 small nucleolar RNA-associated protein 17)
VRVSSANSSDKSYDPVITHFAYDDSPRGLIQPLLVTVDKRRGEGLDEEYSLKFWSWDKSGEYSLEAQMDNPHAAHAITSLAYYKENPLMLQQSSRRRFATAAADGSVKIWQRSINLHPGNSDVKCTWICAYSFNHRETKVSAMAFSYDGSVLAIAQDQLVYLWDPLR